MNALASQIAPHIEGASLIELFALHDIIAALISPGSIAYAAGPGARIRHRSGRLLDRDAAAATLTILRTVAADPDQYGPDLAKAARSIGVHLHQAIALTFRD